MSNETIEKTQFQTFIHGLTPDQLEAYAHESGTTTGYIKTNLIYKNRTPRKGLLKRLLEASDGALTQADLIDHFYVDA